MSDIWKSATTSVVTTMILAALACFGGLIQNMQFVKTLSGEITVGDVVYFKTLSHPGI
jgi:hypothetical protein